MTHTAGAAPAATENLTGTWRLDPGRTTIGFRTKALWVLNVTGTLRAAEGSAAADPSGQVTGRLVIDASSVDTKNATRDRHLRGADFLDAGRHPVMIFDVTGARLGAPEPGTVTGALTICGVTRPAEFQATLRADGDAAVIVDARADIDRSQWGVSWARMGAGLQNQVTVKATFVRC